MSAPAQVFCALRAPEAGEWRKRGHIVIESDSSSLLGDYDMKIVRIALVAVVAAAGLSVAGCAKAPAPAPAVVKG